MAKAAKAQLRVQLLNPLLCLGYRALGCCISLASNKELDPQGSGRIRERTAWNSASSGPDVCTADRTNYKLDPTVGVWDTIAISWGEEEDNHLLKNAGGSGLAVLCSVLALVEPLSLRAVISYGILDHKVCD